MLKNLMKVKISWVIGMNNGIESSRRQSFQGLERSRNSFGKHTHRSDWS
jgi:hypothetical protein